MYDCTIYIGGEIKSSYLELNYNQYFSNSNSKTGKNSKAEEALDGYDLELGAQIPYIPSSTFFTKAFNSPNSVSYWGSHLSGKGYWYNASKIRWPELRPPLAPRRSRWLPALALV